jgi:predicted Rossmann fold flavoprotein
MHIDTLILGAGAAGLMAAAHCGGRVLVVDHARKPGEKIRISGGGRCNFTNIYTSAENFLSANPHFAKSALARYTQWDFIDLVDRHDIAWHEKTLGQLFCDGRSQAIIDMLLAELRSAGADLWLQTEIGTISRDDATGFQVALRRQGEAVTVHAKNLVLATGGKSIPKMGATGLAYQIAQQFGLPMQPTRPALVPFTFDEQARDRLRPLAGVACPARVAAREGPAFEEALLFTHRGLSGPAILQASSYWSAGEAVQISLCHDTDPLAWLQAERSAAGQGRKAPATVLAGLLPKALAGHLVDATGLEGTLADQSDDSLGRLAKRISGWSVTPSGTEGYRTAEVTAGGICTDALDARSLQSRAVPGLFAIGEAVDVTGWLGGYNFQWAWSSAVAAGRAIAASAA